MEPEGSIPHSEGLSNNPNPEKNEPNSSLIIYEKKFSSWPGFESGSPALRAGAITTKPLRCRAGDPGSNPGPGENLFS